MSAATLAVDYYRTTLEKEGREPSYKELAKHAGRSESWGAQTLRKLRKTERPTEPAERTVEAIPQPEVVNLAAASTEAVSSTLGTRALVWVGLLLGLGASVAANVAAAGESLGPRMAAGFAPLALLLAVEILARLRREGRKSWWLLLGTGVIAAVTAVVSYGHMRSLLLQYGESELSATILPLAPDGLILVCCVALLSPKEKS